MPEPDLSHVAMGMLYHRRGTKSFTGTIEGDSVTFRCSCDVFTGISVVVKMPLASARALVARHPAREVLLGFPRAVVELFTSGLTEAEFDLAYRRSTKSLADYELYAVNSDAGASGNRVVIPVEISASGDATAERQQMAFLQ